MGVWESGGRGWVAVDDRESGEFLLNGNSNIRLRQNDKKTPKKPAQNSVWLTLALEGG